MTGFLMVESAAGLPVSQVLLQDPGSRAFPWTQDKHGPCGYQKFIGKESADLVYSVCRSVKNGWVAAFFHWCFCTEVPFCSFVDLWCQPVLVCFCSSGHRVCVWIQSSGGIKRSGKLARLNFCYNQHVHNNKGSNVPDCPCVGSVVDLGCTSEKNIWLQGATFLATNSDLGGGGGPSKPRGMGKSWKWDWTFVS